MRNALIEYPTQLRELFKLKKIDTRSAHKLLAKKFFEMCARIHRFGAFYDPNTGNPIAHRKNKSSHHRIIYDFAFTKH